MANKDAEARLTKVRYKKRAVEDATWIKSYLGRAPIGTVATVFEEQPFITPLLFVYDEAAHAIFMHTAREGRLRTNVEAGGRACFGASTMGRLLPHEEALEFDVEYESVTVFGQITAIEDDEEKRRGLQALLDRYAPHLRPGTDYRPITDDELKRTAVYRLDIDQWAGKRNLEEPDFPGAFNYDSLPRD